MLLWKTRSRPIDVRVCPVVQFDFVSTAFDPREWTMAVFWKEDSGLQLRQITPINEGRDDTSSPSPPRLLSLMILMFLSTLLTHLRRLLDLVDRQVHLDCHQSCPQLLHLLVEKEEQRYLQESAVVQPQSRVSDRSRSSQRKENPQSSNGKKTTAEVKKPSDLPKAKKRKPMDSDEDDEVPQDEPGISSNTQLVHKEHRPAPVPRMNSPTTMTSKEKENLAQQHRVQGVMTQEGQCSTQTFVF